MFQLTLIQQQLLSGHHLGLRGLHTPTPGTHQLVWIAYKNGRISTLISVTECNGGISMLMVLTWTELDFRFPRQRWCPEEKLGSQTLMNFLQLTPRQS